MKHVAVSRAINRGLIATWSDADCVWLKDFRRQYILQYQSRNIDILGQYGTSPPIAFRKHGATICTGLFSVYPTTSAVTIYNKMVASLFQNSRGREYVDQSLFNILINEEGEAAVHPDLSGIDTTQTTTVLSGARKKSDQLVIGYLPFVIFPRGKVTLWKHYHRSPRHLQPSVWHMIADKDGDSKAESMRNAGVFKLLPRWQNNDEYFTKLVKSFNPQYNHRKRKRAQQQSNNI
jgi:hypothetical protein